MNVDTLALTPGLGRNVVFTASGNTAANPREFKAFIISYVGAQQSALLTVGATTLVAVVGNTGAEIADPNFTVGVTPGTIDLTNSAADTAGELVDFINSLTDWKCRLVGLRRSDSILTSGYFIAATTQQVKVTGGYQVSYDPTVAKHITAEVSILDGSVQVGVAGSDVNTRFLRKTGGIYGDYKFGSLIEVHQVDENLTYTGTGLLEVIEVDENSQTDEVVYSGPIPGATTVDGSKSFGQLGVTGVTGRVGRRMLVRARAATTFSVTGRFVVYGKIKALNV